MKKEKYLSNEVVAEIKKLQFHTKQLISYGIAGRYRSSFRGSGMEFEELREYSIGDDIRTIDWKVTARSKKPFIKTYREERELTVLIAVDVSSSTQTGTRTMLKERLISQISAALTFIALNNNDKVGLITFSDQIHAFYPPKKAPNIIWKILREIFAEADQPLRKTNLKELFNFANRVLKKKAIVFVISDFIDTNYESSLNVLAKKHDLTAIVVKDPADQSLPDAGIVRLKDPETGERFLINTSDPLLRETYQKKSKQVEEERRNTFRRLGMDLLELSTERPFVYDLKKYLDKRSLHAS